MTVDEAVIHLQSTATGMPQTEQAKALVLNEVASLRRWVFDLQDGMYVNCVYCGHRYGPRSTTPVALADVLKEHIAKCPKHPLSEANAELARLRARVRELEELLECFIDPEPCRLDHHGMCQEHFCNTPKGECANKIARAALAKGKTP